MGSRATILTFPGGEVHPTVLPEPLGLFLAPKTGNKKIGPLGPLLLAALKAALLLLRDDKEFQSWDSGTQTLCGAHRADMRSL